ncbi:Putative tRNA pseudouridine synthase Pus10 [Babesia microti strain RI]|uniref:tRNA pseudouridine(55) synthase n=1 Tax=Babesia microti (strain RI) TaxID=1133968 RepID=A0A1R4ACE1_BABMR|nr:Putative tRNA pseudouridine synthase Pus10 [Babesia microti strain RI]SJK86683.1 Putative tRNA pseudouridine synthase Pus10 [Babesia microti strain RI]|eukprot:XP_021338811.1 Putative tRNA pseudouridine synthase Pus10 [Babesia microti strain RI]
MSDTSDMDVIPCVHCLELFNKSLATHDHTPGSGINECSKNSDICAICKNLFMNLKLELQVSTYRLPQNINISTIDDKTLIELLSNVQILNKRKLNFDFLVLMTKLYPVTNDIIGVTNENTVYDSFYFEIPDFSVVINNFIAYYSAHHKSLSDCTANNYHFGNYKYVKKKILKHLTNIAYTQLSQYMEQTINEHNEIIHFINTLSTSNPHLFEQFSRVKLYFNYVIKGSQLVLANFFPCRDLVTLTGFYNKLSSAMSQTPWKADGFAFTNPVESSIEQSLARVFNTLFQSCEFKLIASGREDCDVRMMGKGRRFALEIYNCKSDLIGAFFTIKKISTSNGAENHCIIPNTEEIDRSFQITSEDLTKIVNTITKGAKGNALEAVVQLYNKAIVFKLPDWRTLNQATAIDPSKFITRMVKQTGDIKYLSVLSFSNLRFTFKHKSVRRDLQESGESKQKVYSCLVLSTSDLRQSHLDIAEVAINQSPKGFIVSQGNPLRMTHRRSQAYRQKRVYYISTKLLHARLFIMDIITEAGTYVKEFINGDLGRSMPSISHLLGGIDLYVLKLDVIDIKYWN